MSRAWVYIVECSDGRLYTGSHRGEDLGVRIEEHNAGKYPDAFTFKRRPVTLVWSEYFLSATDAIAVERKIKGWSRAKKQALIRGELNELPGLARGRSGRRDQAQADAASDLASAADAAHPSTGSG